MASVFLSYDRDDTEKARRIASALEKAGHSVWWDRQISGGAQFAKEIERALNGADIVIVLWTSFSIESPWVRDEAGAGRDRGRLVPLSLEGTPAPLGFRQFQSIDLGRWTGRGRVPRLREILSAIERQSKEPGILPPVKTPPVRRLGHGPSLNMWALIGTGVGLFFVVVGLLIGRPWERRSSHVPSVAVTAADAPANGIVHDLLDELANLQSIRSGSVRLLATTSREQPDLALQVSSGPAGRGEANVALVKGADHNILWSKQFSGTPAHGSPLNAQMSYIASRVLGCALEGLQAGGKAAREQTLKSYLSGCSVAAAAEGDKFTAVTPLFEQVVKDAPTFKGAWAKLLLAKANAFTYSSEPAPADRESLQRDIAQARGLDSGMPEIAIAEVALLPCRAYGKALQLLEAAQETSPDNAAVLIERSQALLRVGRLSDAISDARQALELDPLSPHALHNYVLALAYSGRLDAARTELKRAERLWTGTEDLRALEFAFNLRFGNPKEMLGTEEFKQSPPMAQLYYRTRADPTPANIDRFFASLDQLHSRRGVHAGDVAGHAQAYGEFHRENDLYQLIFSVPPDEDISLLSDVLFRPALRKFRQDARFMTVARRIGLVDYWTRSGKWPDFCFLDPDQPYDCKKEAAKLA